AAHLNEDPLGRAVGIGRESHRPDAETHINIPDGLLGLRVDHVDGLADDRSGDDVFAVGRDVRIVYGALRLDGLDVCHRRGIDHIHAARRLDDGDIYAPAILADRDVVRVTAQRNAFDDLQRLRIDDI